MKYALVQCVNGNFSIASEHGDNKLAAIVAFHDRCRILWNASDVITAEIVLIDEQLDVVDGYKEFISHEPTPVEPEEAAEE